MPDYKLEEGMKNHPGFMPFTHCNAPTNVGEQKTEEKDKIDSENKK